MGERNNELFGNWVYSTDLFDQSTILRMARHFETLLRSAMAQPDARLSELEMLSEEEQLQQVEEKTRRKQALSQKLKLTVPESVGLSSTTGSEE
jgi:non-ribosomal peptide synthetase component F